MNKMSFLVNGEPIRMSDYFNGDNIDDRAKIILNEYFRGWILVENRDPSINSLIKATEYDYKRVGDGKTIFVKYDMEYAGDKGPPTLEHLENMSIANKENGKFDLMPSDILYCLYVIGEEPTEKQEEPRERIRWYKKGKLSEMKTYEQFVQDLDPYGEEEWSDLETIDRNTEIKKGDTIYWKDGHELAIVDKVLDDSTFDDFIIYGTIFQSNIDNGWAISKELVIGKRDLIKSEMKIKKN